MGEGLKRAFRAARATRVQSTAWHRECLENATVYVDRMRQDVERRATELVRLERDLAFYAEQVTEAERRGKAEFDRERFLVKRNG